MEPEITQLLAQSGTWTKYPVCSEHSTLFPHFIPCSLAYSSSEEEESSCQQKYERMYKHRSER